MYEVKLKPGHPTGVYHRSGFEFTASAPVQLEKIPNAVKNDPWLEVKEIETSKSKKQKE